MKRIKESGITEKFRYALFMTVHNRKGMELVQVAILIAIAVSVGILFSGNIAGFVTKVFGNLMSTEF